MKYLLAILITTALLPLKSLATTRDPIVGESRACYTQLNDSKLRVLDVSSLRINDLGGSKYNSAAAERPEQYTHSYEFVIAGNGGINLIHSPMLMKSISTEILTQCTSIGSVTFRVNPANQSETFGKKQDGFIFKFTCAENLEGITWGTQPCQ